MPITLDSNAVANEQNIAAINRIGRTSMDAQVLVELISCWQKADADQQLIFAVFNERNVAFALLKAAEIKAFVVHPATRNRGVGTRFLTLLAEQINGLYAAEGLDSGFIDKVLKPIQS